MAVKGGLEIDALIRQNRSFAVYRLPGEEVFYFTCQTSGSIEILPSIESLNKRNGYVIAPFHLSETCPIVLINPDEELIFELTELNETNEKNEHVRQEPPAGYKSRFNVFTRALDRNEYDKLVLSHCLNVPKKAGFSPSSLFYKACKQYKHSYVYLFYTPQTGTWLGSSPELLLSGKANWWHTVALAGTMPLRNGLLPEVWDDKNRVEQQLVTDYVRKCLLSFDICPEEEGPYTVQAGELAHLRTDFFFSLSGNQSIGNLLNTLHPTPAVCGLPKEKSLQFIHEKEGYDRRYYSGFVGRYNPEKQTDLYVNLRCMQIEDKQLLLYAGGGLLASSVLQEEWLEIEDKLQTMFGII